MAETPISSSGNSDVGTVAQSGSSPASPCPKASERNGDVGHRLTDSSHRIDPLDRPAESLADGGDHRDSQQKYPSGGPQV